MSTYRTQCYYSSKRTTARGARTVDKSPTRWNVWDRGPAMNASSAAGLAIWFSSCKLSFCHRDYYSTSAVSVSRGLTELDDWSHDQAERSIRYVE